MLLSQWEIITSLAQRMGAGRRLSTPSAIERMKMARRASSSTTRQCHMVLDRRGRYPFSTVDAQLDVRLACHLHVRFQRVEDNTVEDAALHADLARYSASLRCTETPRC